MERDNRQEAERGFRKENCLVSFAVALWNGAVVFGSGMLWQAPVRERTPGARQPQA
jgi:hypothetical protein